MTSKAESNEKKRKKGIAGAAVEDDRPEYLHYIGNPPKENAEHAGLFSTPVIPFVSNQWSYSHWIYRSTDESHICIKCNEYIATGGYDDLSNSIKHVIRNHPELAAWIDVKKHSSARIIQYKATLEREFQPKKATTELRTPINNPLGFTVVGSSRKDNIIIIK